MEIKNADLLAHCKKYYPKGTRYRPLSCYDKPGQPPHYLDIGEVRYDYNEIEDNIECGKGYIYIKSTGRWAEIVKGVETYNGYTKEELISIATKNYPIGINYRPLYDSGKEQEIIHTISHTPDFINGKIDMGWGYVYANGIWAVIIDPITRDEYKPTSMKANKYSPMNKSLIDFGDE